ncbi:MAG: hypothetical protein MZW92_01705 [Comamonadaceae bacterium]|nr:hypothetical protein [Comamonadaceae bacterium]
MAGHWIDLGEPEMYDAIDSPGDPADWALGVTPGGHAHADWHNAYNLKWAEGIARGYRRNAVARRPFLLSRSGTFRDPAPRGRALLGRHRPQPAEPRRPPERAPAPLALGHRLLRVRRRRLLPHRRPRGRHAPDLHPLARPQRLPRPAPAPAHREPLQLPGDRPRPGRRAGEQPRQPARALRPDPVSLRPRPPRVACRRAGLPAARLPLPGRPEVRELGEEKLIGRDLLVATATGPGATHRDVYLPAGEWVDWWTREWLRSNGETFPARPLRQDGLFRLPLFARAGAILPRMAVDDETMNALGRRLDGSTRDELVLRVYPRRWRRTSPSTRTTARPSPTSRARCAPSSSPSTSTPRRAARR